ncbi:hypothetical protein ACFL6S_03515 [Candidatus Poribacteria bacterium]
MWPYMTVHNLIKGNLTQAYINLVYTLFLYTLLLGAVFGQLTGEWKAFIKTVEKEIAVEEVVG